MVACGGTAVARICEGLCQRGRSCSPAYWLCRTADPRGETIARGVDGASSLQPLGIKLGRQHGGRRLLPLASGDACLSGGVAALDLQDAGHTTYEGVVGREIETKDARLVAEATSGDGRSGAKPAGAEAYLPRLKAI